MTTILVTGANRGLGLEFCKQYVAEGAMVFATCRSLKKAEALQATGAEVLPLDVASPESAAALADKLNGRPIDVLINNAGIMGDNTKSALDADLSEWETAFKINVLGPAIVTRALLSNLKMSERPIAVTMGSQAGIYDRMGDAKLAVYRSTKAAAHAVTISLAHALKEEGVLYFSLRPGRTKTDMTAGKGDYEADDSVRLMRERIAEAKPEWTGLFVDRSAKIYPYAGDFAG